MLVCVPKVLVRQYIGAGIRSPMIVLTKEYVLHRATGDQLAITGKDLTYFGRDFEIKFGLEYLGYRRAGQRK